MNRYWKWIFAVAPIIGVAIALSSSAFAQNLIFTDEMSTDAQWSGANGAVVGSDDLLDWSATFGYDYSADDIPPSPNGSDTIGLKMEANQNAGVSQLVVAVHNDAALTGQYAVQVDLWMNWPAFTSDGTTELGGLGVGHDATSPAFVGASFVFTGDGGRARDWLLYKDDSEQLIDSLQYDVPGNNHLDEPFVTTFPEIPDVFDVVPNQGNTGQQRAGAGGFRWLTVTAQVDTEGIGAGTTPETPGLASFYVEYADDPSTRIKIGTIDNTNGGGAVSVAGSINLNYWDAFDSLSGSTIFQFGVFDNVHVYDAWIIEDAIFLEADFDEDGDVDGDDFLAWQTGFGTQSGAMKPDGDYDNDGDVDGDDFLGWQSEFGSVAGDGSTAVPEPGSLLLLFAGALGFCGCRRLPYLARQQTKGSASGGGDCSPVWRGK